MTVEISLAGSVALVSGASRSVGIGAAICRPLGWVGQPKGAANPVSFLASPLGERIAGQILHSRGGF